MKALKSIPYYMYPHTLIPKYEISIFCYYQDLSAHEQTVTVMKPAFLLPQNMKPHFLALPKICNLISLLCPQI